MEMIERIRIKEEMVKKIMMKMKKMVCIKNQCLITVMMKMIMMIRIIVIIIKIHIIHRIIMVIIRIIKIMVVHLHLLHLKWLLVGNIYMRDTKHSR